MRCFLPIVLAGSLLACSSAIDHDASMDPPPPDPFAPTKLVPYDTPDPDLTKTWGQCRTLHQAGTLSQADRADCDARHSIAPETLDYAVRWLVLDDANPDMESEVEKHLLMVNQLYAGVGLSFYTSDYFVHANPTLDLFDAGMEKVTLRELAADVAAFFDLDATDPDGVLDGLKAQLQKVGVAQTVLDGLDLDKPMRSQNYWQVIARAFGEEVVVFVGRPSSNKGQGGVSGPPRGGHDELTTSPVFLRYDKMQKMHGILAHELGHYMGLFHPFGNRVAEPGEVELAVTKEQLGKLYNGAFGSLQGIQSAFFSLVDANGNVDSNFVAYDATENEIQQAERQRMATMAYLPAWTYTYHDELAPFDTLGSFVDALDDESAPVFLKNIKREGKDNNNCVEIAAGGIACSYKPTGGSNAPTVVPGTDPFLSGSITSDDGERANLMSYIRRAGTSHEDSIQFLTAHQLQVVRLGSVSPTRLNLRNHQQAP
jgi:hypothetical protein